MKKFIKRNQEALGYIVATVSISLIVGALYYITEVHDHGRFKDEDCIYLNNKHPNLHSVIQITNDYKGSKTYGYIQILPKNKYEFHDYAEYKFIDAMGEKVDCNLVDLINLGNDK